MTTNSIPPSVEYIENGTTRTYAVPFRFRTADSLIVDRINTITATIVRLNRGADYSVAGANQANGGSITTTVAGAAGVRIRVRRRTPRIQDTNYTANDTFPAESHEDALDRAMLIAQELDVAVGDVDARSLKVLPGQSLAPFDKLAFIGRFLAGGPNGDLVPASGTGNDPALRADLASSVAGSAIVAFVQEGIGATVRSILSKNRDVISVKDFGAKGDGITDDTLAIKAALAYAKSLVIDDTPSESYGYVKKGGATVYLPRGLYKVSGTLEFFLNVSIIGDGMNSSIIWSTADQMILRNDPTTTAAGTYNREGTILRDFGILGDPTKPNQIGLGLLRLISSLVMNVAVNRCGGAGTFWRECTANVIVNLRCAENTGEGIRMRKGLVGFWDSPENDLPSNANVFINARMIANGSYGIWIDDTCNGIVFEDALVEYNNATPGGNFGKQINVTSGSYVPIIFNRLWAEGSNILCHVYVDHPSAQVVLNNWRHFALGELCDRALVATAGGIVIRDGFSSANPYRLINGSRAPFRINHLAVGIEVFDHRGAEVSGIELVERMDGSRTGLDNNLYQTGRYANYGNHRQYSASGAVSAMEFIRDDEVGNPWCRFEPFYKALAFGDVMLKRSAQRTLALDTRGGPQYFDAGATWNGNHLVMGAFHLWVDAAGNLRIKNGLPTGDTDGAIVGAQA